MASWRTDGQADHDSRFLERLLRSSCEGCHRLDDEGMAEVVAEVRTGLGIPIVSWWEMVQGLVCIAGAMISVVLIDGVIRDVDAPSIMHLVIIAAIVLPTAYMFRSLALRWRSRGVGRFVSAAGRALETRGVHCDEAKLRAAARQFLWRRNDSVRFVVVMQLVVLGVFVCAVAAGIQEHWLDIYVASFVAVLFGTALFSGISFGVGLCLWPISRKYGEKAIKLMAVLGLVVGANLYVFMVLGGVYLVLRG